jgi:DNA-binding transcriptional ArsR family regulator
VLGEKKLSGLEDSQPPTSDTFNAIAEPRRRDIPDYLAPRADPAGDIVAALGLAQPSVSKHLRVLRDVGLVDVRRDGRQVSIARTQMGSDPSTNGPAHSNGTGATSCRVKERAERD